MKIRRRHLNYGLVVLFNAALIYLLSQFVVKNVHLRLLWEDVIHISQASIWVVAAIYTLVALVYGIRLALLMDVPVSKAFCIASIGNGLNRVLPCRLGDVLRIYFAKRFYRMRMTRMVSATFLERYSDMLILLLMAVVLICSPPYHHKSTVYYLGLSLLGIALLCLYLYRVLILKNTCFQRFCCRSRRVMHFLTFIHRMSFSKNRSTILFSSAVIWASIIIAYDVFFQINLLGVSFSWTDAVFLCFTATLSFAIPYSIGSIGVFESTVTYYLMNHLHVMATDAIALALVFHFFMALPQLILMLLAFASRKVPHIMRFALRAKRSVNHV